MRMEHKKRAKTGYERRVELNQTKKNAIKAAYDLGYLRIFDNVEENIRKAESIGEVNRIMITCRRAS